MDVAARLRSFGLDRYEAAFRENGVSSEVWRCASVGAAIAGERGYLARLVGDGVPAYFGWPNGDEAYAESAVIALKRFGGVILGLGARRHRRNESLRGGLCGHRH